MRPALLFAFTLTLTAQESRFDVRSQLVLVPATVTDPKGRTVDGLELGDFLVFDNGVPQKIGVDITATGVAPIALVVAVQSSGISTAVLEKVRRIGGMIQPLITGERGCAGLVSFADHVTWLQECTQDADALERSFHSLQAGELKEARMLDAVHQAIVRLAARPNSRRVLLLVSESRDRGSETDLDTVTVAAQTAGVAVYAATYSAIKAAFTSKTRVADPSRPSKPKTPNDNMGTVDGAPPSKYNRKTLPPEHQVDGMATFGELARLHQANATQVLSVGTGGITFPFTRQKALETAIEKLGAELHSQYVLSFVPQNASVGYHRLDVKVAREGKFEIRARPGYWQQEDSR